MNGRKTIVGICMFCALLVSAIAAQSASAITGTTVFTCKEGAGDVGGATFAGSHCKPGESSGKYGHYNVAANTTTSLRGHAVGSMIIKTNIGGLGVTFSSTSVEGTGWVQNNVAENGEHYVQAETKGIYSGVTINVSKCFVYTDEGGTVGAKEKIDTETLITTSKGQGDAVKFTPKEGEVISRLWILDKNQKGAGGECICPGTFTLTGSVLGKPDGATFVFKHAEMTEQGTFKLGTAKAGFEGSIAIESEDPANIEDTYTPLSVTTVTT